MTVQDTAFGAIDRSWEEIRKHYLAKYAVTYPETAPEDFRSMIIRDWTSRCWQTSQNPSGHTEDAPRICPTWSLVEAPVTRFCRNCLLANGVPNTKPTAGQVSDALERPNPDGGSKTLEQVHKERAEFVRRLEERVKNAKVLLSQKQAAEEEALVNKVKKAKELLLQPRQATEEELLRDRKASEVFALKCLKLNEELSLLNGALERSGPPKRVEPLSQSRLREREIEDDQRITRHKVEEQDRQDRIAQDERLGEDRL